MDALFVSVQILIAAMLSSGHILIPFFVLSQDRTFVLHLDIPSWDRVEEETFRIGFYSQSGYSFVDQSRRQISSGFREDGYGLAGRHS